VERVLDKQKIYDQLLGDITMLLQDQVNNPLAVISVTSHEIRRKFEKDNEIMRWLDRIDGAVQRIENTVRDIHAYEARKMIETTHASLNEESPQ
jgi:signal transduction histidine kinase